VAIERPVTFAISRIVTTKRMPQMFGISGLRYTCSEVVCQRFSPC
jgi:hypothetical protein